MAAHATPLQTTEDARHHERHGTTFAYPVSPESFSVTIPVMNGTGRQSFQSFTRGRTLGWLAPDFRLQLRKSMKSSA